MSTTSTKSPPRSITLCYSPLEAHLAGSSTTYSMHEMEHGTAKTLCGKSAEGWKMVHNKTEKPNRVEDVTCTPCRKSRKSRARGDNQRQP